ncbi:MAG: MerR family DNA-binding transcriptional regulator [Patescibacteria group bacterium]
MVTIDKKVRVSEAAKILGVSAETLRNWEKSDKLRPQRSAGKQRYYLLQDIKNFALDLKAIGLAWAISPIAPDLSSDLYCERQDRFTSRLSKMGSELQNDQSISTELASLITLVVGEIGDNSFAHNLGNWPDVPGIFYSYDTKKKIIVLADRGRGVKATLLQVRPLIATDTEALTVAFNEVVSGRNPEKRGNGLKVVRNVIESKEIGLLFRSGIAMASVDIKKPDSIIIKMAKENIRGTYSVIMF